MLVSEAMLRVINQSGCYFQDNNITPLITHLSKVCDYKSSEVRIICLLFPCSCLFPFLWIAVILAGLPIFSGYSCWDVVEGSTEHALHGVFCTRLISSHGNVILWPKSIDFICIRKCTSDVWSVTIEKLSSDLAFYSENFLQGTYKPRWKKSYWR